MNTWLLFIKKDTQSDAEFLSVLTLLMKKIQLIAQVVRYTIADEAVENSTTTKMITTVHPKDAILTLLISESVPIAEVALMVSKAFVAYQFYQVQQFTPLLHVANTGRVEGMCQIALFKRPSHIDNNTWLDIWLNSHTDIAINTQSTFSYRQNRVLAAYPENADSYYDAIVEEQFPSAAMFDKEVFYNAKNDTKKCQENEKAMITSVSRFIDFTAFECLPMSEYVL